MVNDEQIEQMVNENMSLIHYAIKRYLPFIYLKPDYEDYVSVGKIGLINAAMRFNPELNNKFSTYAISCILGEIKRDLRDNQPVKFNRKIKDIVFTIQLKYKAKNDSSIDFYEFAIDELDTLDITDEEKQESLKYILNNANFVSLESPVNDDDTITIKDVISDKGISFEEDVYYNDFIKTCLESFPEMHQKVILMILNNVKQLTVAKTLNISQPQVSRIMLRFKAQCINLFLKANQFTYAFSALKDFMPSKIYMNSVDDIIKFCEKYSIIIYKLPSRYLNELLEYCQNNHHSTKQKSNKQEENIMNNNYTNKKQFNILIIKTIMKILTRTNKSVARHYDTKQMKVSVIRTLNTYKLFNPQFESYVNCLNKDKWTSFMDSANKYLKYYGYIHDYEILLDDTPLDKLPNYKRQECYNHLRERKIMNSNKEQTVQAITSSNTNEIKNSKKITNKPYLINLINKIIDLLQDYNKSLSMSTNI